MMFCDAVQDGGHLVDELQRAPDLVSRDIGRQCSFNFPNAVGHSIAVGVEFRSSGSEPAVLINVCQEGLAKFFGPLAVSGQFGAEGSLDESGALPGVGEQEGEKFHLRVRGQG